MKRVFTAFLILLLLAAVVGGMYWMIAIRGYPWWTGVALGFGALGILFGILFFRRYLRRRNEQEFVQRVIAQDEEAIRSAPEAEKPHLIELQRKWRESVELLRNSSLRRRGNPLYVLPWYIILGESGAGKTSAVRNTNLNSPLGESGAAGISVTRNCDWWFFEEAVILDTAGRYTIPIDEGVDREEWERFLSLLARYRLREPVNGVLVTIAADKLLEMNEARLSEEGQNVRKRVDQLMRILGASIPVYVMVTKIDLIPGMLEFSNLLPQEGRNQAMGYVNPDLSADWKAVLDDALAAVARRLRELHFIMVHRGGEPEPEMFLFLNGFDRLKPALDLYARSLFVPNPYQPTPPFRGMFFSSAIQEGRGRPEHTGFFATGEEEEAGAVLHNNGIFLRDLFQSILPKDRSLFRPIPEFLRTRRRSLALAALSWTFLWASLGGLAAFSHFNARSALDAASTELSRPAALTGVPSLDLLAMRRLGAAIRTVEGINRRWVIPWAGFRQGERAERELKARYVRLFREGMLKSFDTALLDGLRPAPDDSAGDGRLNAFGCLVARIDVLRDYRKGKTPRSFDRFRDSAGEVMVRMDSTLTRGTASFFGDAYLDYLDWSAGAETREGELKSLRSVLEDRLRAREDLQWIALNWIEEPDPVRPGDFWGNPEEDYDGDTVVPGVYTRASLDQIQSFFTALAGAVASPLADGEERDFWRWYEVQMYEAWASFALAFPRDGGLALSVPGGRRAIAAMTAEENPYFDFLTFMAGELRDLPPALEPPSWAALVIELDDLRREAEADSSRSGTILEKLDRQKDKMFRSTVGKADRRKLAEMKRRSAAVKAWTDYTAAIEGISDAVVSPERCFQAVSDLYTDAGSAVSPFTVARERFNRLQSLLGHENASFVWDLVLGPREYLLDYCIAEAAEVLQERWDRDVLAGIRTVDRDNIPGVLFAEEEGLVWKFVEETARPFVSDTRTGWVATDRGGPAFPLREEFVEFLNEGPRSVVTYESSYAVTLETLPVEANREAGVKPFGCTLTLQCPAERQALENYNYQRSQTFTWSPENCGETVLTILFPELALTRSYSGKLGFARFLEDFSDGSRRFVPEDFPRERERLEQMGVSFIRVSYRISGARAVTRLLESNPARVPPVIAGH